MASSVAINAEGWRSFTSMKNITRIHEATH